MPKTRYRGKRHARACGRSPGNVPKKMDILSKLPLEIVMSLSQYLEAFDLLRLRRVCRQWKAALSAQSVIYAAVQGYFPGQAIKPEDSAAYLEKRIRIERGLFASEACLAPEEWFLSYHQPRSPHYHSGRLAWIDVIEDQYCRGVMVLNLWNGKAQCLQHEDPDKVLTISELGLSDTLVVAVEWSRREFYVWHIQSCEFARVETPTPLPHRPVYVDGTKVIFRHKKRIIYWTFESRVLHEINHYHDDALYCFFGDLRTLIPNPSKGDLAVTYANENYDSDWENDLSSWQLQEADEVPLETLIHTAYFKVDDGLGKVIQRKDGRVSFRGRKEEPDILQESRESHCVLNNGQFNLRVRTEVVHCPNLNGDNQCHCEPRCHCHCQAYYRFRDTFHTLDYDDLAIHKVPLGDLKQFDRDRRRRHICLSPGVIYVTGHHRVHHHRNQITIMHADPPCRWKNRVVFPDNDALIHEYSPYKTIQGPEYFKVWGDQDFMVAINSYGLVIGSFNPLSTYDARKVDWNEDFVMKDIPGGSWLVDNPQAKEDEKDSHYDSEEYDWSDDVSYESWSEEGSEAGSEEGSE